MGIDNACVSELRPMLYVPQYMYNIDKFMKYHCLALVLLFYFLVFPLAYICMFTTTITNSLNDMYIVFQTEYMYICVSFFIHNKLIVEPEYFEAI